MKGKGLNKRGAETLEKLNKFQKKTADDAPGRGGDAEPASGTARSASSTPTKKQAEPGSQVRRPFSGSLVAMQQANILSRVQVDVMLNINQEWSKLANRGDTEDCTAHIHLNMTH